MARAYKVLKFGGSSLKDAKCFESVKNTILRHAKTHPVVVVLSAAGKTTRSLQNSLSQMHDQRSTWQTISDISKDLSIHNGKALIEQTEIIRYQLATKLATCNDIIDTKNQQTAQTIKAHALSLGESLTTELFAAFFKDNTSLSLTSIDATELISLNRENTHEAAKVVDIPTTFQKIRTRFEKSEHDITFVPGFYGADETGKRALLGFDGSDYSAALIAAGLQAEILHIYSDIQGIYPADPKLLDKLPNELQHHCESPFKNLPMSFAETIAQSGAHVLHPKTLDMLYDWGIPCNVSHYDDSSDGTLISPDARLSDERIKIPFAITNQPNVYWTRFCPPNQSYTLTVLTKRLRAVDQSEIISVQQNTAGTARLEFDIFHTEKIKNNLITCIWPYKNTEQHLSSQKVNITHYFQFKNALNIDLDHTHIHTIKTAFYTHYMGVNIVSKNPSKAIKKTQKIHHIA